MTFRAVWAVCATCVVAWSPAVVAQGQKPGPLTLPQALQRAANANPRIAAADRTIGMADGRREQANALPNPTLGVEVDNFASGQSGAVQGAETTLQLSQLIELGGKRDARVQAALGDYDSARWEREAARLELLSETTIAFVEALSAQRRIQLLERQAAALEKLVPLMQRRVEAGASSPAEVSRTQAAVGLARLERERARTALAIARRELAALVGMDRPDFVAVSGDFGRISQPAPFDAAIKAIEDNPQLMRWTAVRARRDAELLSARLKAVPDVTASVAWRLDADPRSRPQPRRHPRGAGGGAEDRCRARPEPAHPDRRRRQGARQRQWRPAAGRAAAPDRAAGRAVDARDHRNGLRPGPLHAAGDP